MQVTAYPDWASVAALFRPLYPDDPPLPDGFREELAVIEAEARDPEDRAAMALRFVQTYARYLAIGIGEGGFRPRDLEETAQPPWGLQRQIPVARDDAAAPRDQSLPRARQHL